MNAAHFLDARRAELQLLTEALKAFSASGSGARVGRRLFRRSSSALAPRRARSMLSQRAVVPVSRLSRIRRAIRRSRCAATAVTKPARAGRSTATEGDTAQQRRTRTRSVKLRRSARRERAIRCLGVLVRRVGKRQRAARQQQQSASVPARRYLPPSFSHARRRFHMRLVHVAPSVTASVATSHATAKVLHKALRTVKSRVCVTDRSFTYEAWLGAVPDAVDDATTFLQRLGDGPGVVGWAAGDAADVHRDARNKCSFSSWARGVLPLSKVPVVAGMRLDGRALVFIPAAGIDAAEDAGSLRLRDARAELLRRWLGGLDDATIAGPRCVTADVYLVEFIGVGAADAARGFADDVLAESSSATDGYVEAHMLPALHADNGITVSTVCVMGSASHLFMDGGALRLEEREARRARQYVCTRRAYSNAVIRHDGRSAAFPLGADERDFVRRQLGLLTYPDAYPPVECATAAEKVVVAVQRRRRRPLVQQQDLETKPRRAKARSQTDGASSWYSFRHGCTVAAVEPHSVGDRPVCRFPTAERLRAVDWGW